MFNLICALINKSTQKAMVELIKKFTKVHSEDSTRVFRIKTEWADDHFYLSVVENGKAWHVLVTSQHIRMLAGQHERDPDVYLHDLREYICDSKPSITFNLKNNQFLVYRKVENEKFRIKYFFVELEEVRFQDIVENFIDNLLAAFNEALEMVQKEKEQRIVADNQKTLYQQKCQEFAELKRKVDLQMYSAFALVLNEKKSRIRFLTEMLEDYQPKGKLIIPSMQELPKKNNNVRPPEPQIEPAASTSKKEEVVSDPDSSPAKGYNTDEEKESVFSQNTVEITNEVQDMDFLEDNSPPRLTVNIPKRIKNAKMSEAPLTTNLVTEKEVQAPENRHKEEDMDVPDSDCDDKACYSTQDLLDLM